MPLQISSWHKADLTGILSLLSTLEAGHLQNQRVSAILALLSFIFSPFYSYYFLIPQNNINLATVTVLTLLFYTLHCPFLLSILSQYTINRFMRMNASYWIQQQLSLQRKIKCVTWNAYSQKEREESKRFVMCLTFGDKSKSFNSDFRMQF